MNLDVIRLAKAVDFAARKHVSQRRKGEAAEPYFNHLSEVARLLAEATDGQDVDLVIAGLLHDTIEDQEVTREELEAEFGEKVANIVVEVTDDKSLEKAERKRLQVVNTPHKSKEAKMLKMADKSANLSAILSSPPPNWDLARRQTYFDWAKSVVEGCRGVNPKLEAHFDSLYKQRPSS